MTALGTTADHYAGLRTIVIPGTHRSYLRAVVPENLQLMLGVQGAAQRENPQLRAAARAGRAIVLTARFR